MKSIDRYPMEKDYGQGNNKRNQRSEAKGERKKDPWKLQKWWLGLRKQFIISEKTCNS